MEEPHMPKEANLEKLHTGDSNHITTWKRQNYGDNNKISGCREWGIWIGRAQRTFRAVNILCMSMYEWKYLHVSFYCTSFYCTWQMMHYKSKVCGNPVSSKSVSSIFQTELSCFISLYHILIILIIFQTFHYYFICYGYLWSGIFDVTIAKNYDISLL